MLGYVGLPGFLCLLFIHAVLEDIFNDSVAVFACHQSQFTSVAETFFAIGFNQ